MGGLGALTGEQLARAQRRLFDPLPGSRIEAARNFGIDLSLLAEQLRLTPAERAETRRRHRRDRAGAGRRAQEAVMQFERAVQALCDAGVEFVIIGGVAASAV